MTDAWDLCLNRLQQSKPEGVFRAWIKPLAFVSWSDSERTLFIGAPNRQKLEWARAELLGDIEALAAEFFHPEAKVQIDLSAPKLGAAAVGGMRTEADLLGEPEIQSEPAHMTMVPQIIESDNRHVERAKINTDLTFDNFVTGKANQMARAAAEQVAERPGTSYNPLFFYGGVGLGKTHLIHAVGNTILKANPNAKVRYIHAEQYVSDVVKAYQRKAFDEFKNYYHSLDLLLIDDIQFFGGKSRTQEEFFYAFEALANTRKQIIITSDTYPKDMQDIDERLVSRFGSGLTVAIEAPELEMRVAILLKKAEQSHFTLPDDVAFFIAKLLRSNVRELEGALKKVIAFSHFNRKPVDMDLVKEALKEILTVTRGQVSIETIQKTVADYYKIKVADMYSKRRPANIVLPRQVAMYITKELTQKSLPEIGELFGGRDHTTVLHAVRKIAEVRKNDNQLNHDLHVLEQTLRG